MNVQEYDYNMSDEYENVPSDFTEEEINSGDTMLAEFNYDDVAENHWLLERASMLNSLQLLGIAVREGSDQVSSLVQLRKVADGIELTSNTGDILVRSVVPYLNNERVMDNIYVVDFKALMEAVKCAGSKFVLKEHDDTLIVCELGGEIEMEQFKASEEVFEQPVLDNLDNVQAYQSADFLAILNRIAASMSLAQTAESKKVRINEEGTAYCNFVASLFRAGGSPVKNITLRAIDVQMLQKLLLEGSDFAFKELEEGYMFVTQISKVVLRKWKAENAEGIQEYFINDNSWFNLPTAYTTKIISLIKGMLGSMGVMRIRTEDKKLVFHAKQRNGKQLYFPILNVLPGDVSFNVLCPVQVVHAMLTLFKDVDTIKVTVKDNKVQFATDKIQVVFGSSM